MSDFKVSAHGTIFLLDPLTAAARRWADEHLRDDALYFGGRVVGYPDRGHRGPRQTDPRVGFIYHPPREHSMKRRIDAEMKRRDQGPPPPPLIVTLDKTLRLASDRLIETGGHGRRWLAVENALLTCLAALATKRQPLALKKQRGRIKR